MSVRSPSTVSADSTGSTPFETGRLSPVSAASATSSVAASSRRPSAGRTSPASIETTSPGTSSPAGIAFSSPSRRTRAVTIIICWRAATAAAALPSCRRPRTALKSVRRRMTKPVPTSPSGQMLPIPATRRTICMTSRYWRMNACQRGSDLASANLFGPYFWSRVAASPLERPCVVVTPSSCATSSPLRTYQTGCSSSLAAAGAISVVATLVPPLSSPRPSRVPTPRAPRPCRPHRGRVLRCL